jgi:hypothetical protein
MSLDDPDGHKIDPANTAMGKFYECKNRTGYS